MVEFCSGKNMGWLAYFFQITLVFDQPSPVLWPLHSRMATMSGMNGISKGRFRLNDAPILHDRPVVESMTLTPHKALPGDCPAKQSLQKNTPNRSQASPVATPSMSD
jgi:hypothetical protein